MGGAENEQAFLLPNIHGSDGPNSPMMLGMQTYQTEGKSGDEQINILNGSHEFAVDS